MTYKYKLSVCVCIKNEAKYIPIFLEHYVKQGVDHFYIVNNNSSDNIEEVINISNYKDLITLINDNRDLEILKSPNSASHHVQLLNTHFYPRICEETEWAIIIDADEFMFGKNGYTLNSYLSTIPNDIGCIYVIWNIINPYLDELGMISDNFNINNNIYRLNYDKINNISSDIINANKFGKSIIRTSMLKDNIKLWIHKNQVNGKVLINYGVISDNNYDNYDNYILSEDAYSKLNVTLHHYAIRNYDDYIKKRNQIGVVPEKNNFIKGLFNMIKLDKEYLVEDKSIRI